MRAQTESIEVSLALRQIVDGVEIGIVLCDAAGRIAYVNRCGMRHLARADALLDSGGVLGATDHACAAELQRRLAVGTSEGCDGMLARRGGDGRPLAVHVHCLGEGGLDPAASRLRLVTIVDCAPGPEVAADALASMHGLTPSESRLAEGMLLGLQLAGIARRARVSINTVRTQLKQLFAKTATRRQSELVRVLAACLPRFAARQRRQG